MQSVKGAQFLNITFLLALFAAASVASVFGTIMIRLTSMYLTLTLKF